MRKALGIVVSLVLSLQTAPPQTPQTPQRESAPEDVVRITTNLVQTDVVVTDKNDQPVNDLKLEEFELYDNGKKQEIKFLEFVSIETGKRVEGAAPRAAVNKLAETASNGISARELKRVIAFVVDDLTIPVEDMARVRDLLLNFVNNQMINGDLVSIVRVVGGTGLLEQFTTDKELLRRAIYRLSPKSHPFGGATPDFGAINPAIAPALDVGPIAGNNGENIAI